MADGSFRSVAGRLREDWCCRSSAPGGTRRRFVLTSATWLQDGFGLPADAPAEYAEFVSAVLNRLRSRWGLEPSLWELALEPEGLPTVRPSGRQLVQMLVAAGARARARVSPGHSLRLGVHADNFTRYLDDILSVSGARTYLAELVYHRYGDKSRAV